MGNARGLLAKIYYHTNKLTGSFVVCAKIRRLGSEQDFVRSVVLLTYRQTLNTHRHVLSKRTTGCRSHYGGRHTCQLVLEGMRGDNTLASAVPRPSTQLGRGNW